MKRSSELPSWKGREKMQKRGSGGKQKGVLRKKPSSKIEFRIAVGES